MPTRSPDPAPEAPATAYLYMDAMRAVLALAVTFGHAWVLAIRDYRPTAEIGTRVLYGLAGFAHPAVMMFFVLSGYWIGRSVVGRAERGWCWRGYLLDRLSRLLLVLVPALLLGGALDAVGLWTLDLPTLWHRTGSWVLNKDVAADLSPVTLAGNLLFLQGIAVNAFGSNGPLWSVAAEFWYYLWFPALWLSWRSGRASAMLATLGVGFAAPALLQWFPVWLCGAALVALERQGAMRTAGRGTRRCVAIAAVLAFAVALAAARLGGAVWEDWGLGIGFAALIWATLIARPRVVRGVRMLAWYGARASFSLYAIHFPVVALIVGVAIGGRRSAPDAAGIAIVAAATAAAVATSIPFARLTEARTRAVRERLARWLAGRGVAAAGAAI